MKTENISVLVEDFTKVIQYKIISTIKNHYGSLNVFKLSYSKAMSGNNCELARFNKNFHVESKILAMLTRDSKGSRHLSEVLHMLDNRRLVYKHKCDIVRPTEWSKPKEERKKFSKPSTFYIPFDELDRLFGMDGDNDSPFVTNSGYYTKTQHDLIDKYVFRYGASQRKTYDTSSDRFKARNEKMRADRKMEKLKKLAAQQEHSQEDIDALVDGLEV